MALSLEKLLLLLPYDAKPDKVTVLDLAEKGIVGLPKQTAFLKSLRRLSLAKNQLTDVTPVSSITTLTNLDLSRNTNLTSLVPLKALTHLVVLTIGGCSIRSLEGIEGSKATLKSLVANDNQIILSIDPSTQGAVGMAPIVEANRKALMAVANVIETIVLSRNPNLTGGYKLVEDGKGSTASKGDIVPSLEEGTKERIMEDPKNPLHLFGAFEALRKLSLSECGIKCLPRRWYLPLLTELRLANNSIDTISNGVVLKSIKTLDISNNELVHWNVLHRCKFLKQLSIKGNPLTGIQTPMPSTAEGKKAAAPTQAADTNATLQASPLHGNPLEVLYLRAVLPQLEMLDGRAFIEPPAGSPPEAIQQAIKAIHKQDYLARKASSTTEENETTVTKGKSTQRSSKTKKAVKAAREEADEDEDDGAMDETLLARKRRRAENSPPMPDAAREKVPLPPTEDKEYEVPAAIASKAAAMTGSANLVKRERHYAVGEGPQAAKGSNASKAAVVLSNESAVLAALRQPAPSGW